ncbi:MAG TPA: hypothetical protein VJ570_02980, partial [Holophagaceae bacterium]|nr:hypothetical protein [Holophagaceae bacterium]
MTSLLGELDRHLLAEGTHLRAYERLGAHPAWQGDVAGTAFAVWAPNARSVSVVGDFNGWDGSRDPLQRVGEGFWEGFVPGAARGQCYKFELVSASGEPLPLKADPFAFAMEEAPGCASIIHGLPGHAWADSGWMRTRGRRRPQEAP